VIVDVNLLLFAVDRRSPFHERAKSWLTQQINGTRRVGLPWQTLGGFLRIVTHPRALSNPLTPVEAMGFLEEWLARETVWIPAPGRSHAQLLGSLMEKHDVRGSLIPDARLAALAIEHGLAVYSADTDFARFSEIEWRNPLDKGAR